MTRNEMKETQTFMHGIIDVVSVSFSDKKADFKRKKGNTTNNERIHKKCHFSPFSM